MKYYTLAEFESVGIDSLYRLVVLAAKRATQIGKPESRPLVPVKSKKPTMIALEEILDGKVGFRTDESDEDDYDVG